MFAKLVTAHSNVPAIEMTFFRFLFGSVIAFLFIIKEKSPIAPKRWRSLVIWRGVFNGTAVILFFLGVQHTTITNANILNMTYPAFLFITAAWINREKSHPVMFIFLALTLTGITLVIHPDFHHIRIGDVYSLLSGVVTAFGVSTLRKARQFDSTASILFYMMSVGCIINLILVLPVFVIPHGLNLVFVLLSRR